MGDRSYLSIGEVLSLLQPEFDDLTISKIRFLESQGLLEPERTPSGYRKFYETDVERLRWILRQQREQYLPLKVIRGRLGEPEADPASPARPSVAEPAAAPPAAGDDPAGAAAPASGPPDPQPTDADRAPAVGAADAAGGPTRQVKGQEERPRRQSAPEPSRPDAEQGPNPLAPLRSGVSLTADELCSAAAIERSALTELERFGLISSRPSGSAAYYDEEALTVAQLAGRFMRHGVEARHLRMYKTAAEREAGVFEQLVMPLLRQRNPRARREAMERLTEVARLGQDLRAAMLRIALRDELG